MWSSWYRSADSCHRVLRQLQQKKLLWRFVAIPFHLPHTHHFLHCSLRTPSVIRVSVDGLSASESGATSTWELSLPMWPKSGVDGKPKKSMRTVFLRVPGTTGFQHWRLGVAGRDPIPTSSIGNCAICCNRIRSTHFTHTYIIWASFSYRCVAKPTADWLALGTQVTSDERPRFPPNGRNSYYAGGDARPNQMSRCATFQLGSRIVC